MVSLLFDASQVNLYVYVGGQPLTQIDPTGQDTLRIGARSPSVSDSVCPSTQTRPFDTAFDSSLNLSASIGAATNIGASVAYTVEVTSAESVDELTGIEWYVGGAVDPELFVSLDYVQGIASEYQGGSFSIGAGVGALPAQVQGGFTGGINLLSSTWFTPWFTPCD